MSERTKLSAEPRTEFGKGAARKARRDGKIPAVIYGHGADPVHILLPAHETLLAVRTPNAILDIEGGDRKGVVMVKDVQREPVTWDIEHVDLLTVKRGEKVSVVVPVHYEGEVAPGQALAIDAAEIAILADALSLPEALVVNVDGLEDANVTAEQIELPAGVELEVEGDTVIASVSVPEEIELPEPGEEGETAEGAESSEEGSEEPAEGETADEDEK